MNLLTLKLGNGPDTVAHQGSICPKCKFLIFSRARHDFRSCPCGEIAIDGGFEYYRGSFTKLPPIPVTLSLVGVSKKELFDDWNYSKDKFGLIKEEDTGNMQVFAMATDGKNVVSGDTTKNRKIDLTKPQQTVTTVSNMKLITFAAAVALAAESLRQSKPQGFSIHEVTKELRNQVNSGSVGFSNKTVESVDGVTTYRVDHDEVRASFLDAFDRQYFPNLKKEFNGVYNVYVNTSAPTLVVTPTPAPTVTVKPTSAVVSNSSRYLDSSEGEAKLIAYVGNIAKGDSRTIKNVQSRFKGCPMTSQEIADKLTKLGFFLENLSAPVSQWIVKQY